MGFILFIVAVILYSVFVPLGFIFTLIKSILLLDFDIINKYYYKLAIGIDQLGNVAMSAMFNKVLIHKDSKDKFGDIDETISSVIGKNKVSKKLTYTGRLLDKLLDLLDENHSINSIGE